MPGAEQVLPEPVAGEKADVAEAADAQAPAGLGLRPVLRPPWRPVPGPCLRPRPARPSG